MILRAPAKLNLTLEVLNRRDDGYHNLRSVMVPVTLYDEIEVSRSGAQWRFESSDGALHSDNLVERALQAAGVATTGLVVRLQKNIPVGAGLGGGSSDAASILTAVLDGSIPAEHPLSDPLATARSLGSDVPFFLCGTAAIVEGTGERVTALGAPPPWGATIVQPPVAVATAQAYAMLGALHRETRPRNTSVTLQCGEALQRADFDGVVSLMSNDFETVIAPHHPDVAAALEALRAWSPVPATLTGSGSCVFTLWQHAPTSAPLDLPPGFKRFDVRFAVSDSWRPAQ